MGEAFGQSLPLAIGVALSPVSIIAVVLMLTTPQARSNGPAFMVGWLLGLSVVGAVVLAVVGPSDAGADGQAAAWVDWLQAVLGVLLLVVAVSQFRGRPRGNEEAPLPTWMSRIDRFKPGAALGAGVVLAAANPKNLLLSVGAAAGIAQTGIAAGQQAVAYAAFAVVGTLGVAVPVGIYFGSSKRSADVLGRLKDWMVHNNAVIMSVLCLVIGAKLIGDAISGPAA